MKFVRKIFFTIIYLFIINFSLLKFNYNIPINIFNIIIVYFFGFPGVLMLLFFSRW